MRITGLRTIPLEVPGDEPVKGDTASVGCLAVFLDTDAGVTGESLLFAFDPALMGVFDRMLDVVRQDVIGEDPEYVERIGQKLWARSRFFGHEGLTAFARSAVDRACWDAVARATGRPLYRLLGACRDSVPAYASGLWLSQTPDQLVAAARAFIDEGHRAIKMRVGKATPKEDAERVRIVRDAIGPGIALMVDANKRFDEPHALRLGRLLERYDLTWFEEPLPAEQVGGYARLAAALDTPIAAGESVFTARGFQALLDQRAVDVLMPDFGRVGGLSAMLRVARMAEPYDIPVSPHNYPQESLQVLGSIPNGTWLECLPWFSPLYSAQIKVVDGRVRVPAEPGALALDPAALERFRYQPAG